MKHILEPLSQLADHLDKNGFRKEADMADEIIKAIAEEQEEEPAEEMHPLKVEEPVEEEDKTMASDEEISLRRRARRRQLMLKNS